MPGSLPDLTTSGSSVTAGDFDGDGHIDLFVGSRYIPGKYPLAPRSYLLRNKGDGSFEDVTEEMAPELVHVGMVTDARFVELNGDEWVDLVVVGEWMEIGIYTNSQGRGFLRKTDAFKESTGGWWLTIAAEDMDGDGDQDLVLGNFGLNNPYKPNDDRPASLVFKDFDNNGSIDPVFGYYIADTNAFAFSRDELIGQMPFMKRKFSDYKTFAKTELKDFFTKEQLEGSDTLKATMLESVYLENDGDGNFTIKKLPIEAQFTPIYAIKPIDLNGDGYPDLVMGGNLANSRISVGPYVAGQGLTLLGDGNGNFSTLNPVLSGLDVRGDMRDISKIDIQEQTYLIFSRYDGSVKTFRVDHQGAMKFNLADN